MPNLQMSGVMKQPSGAMAAALGLALLAGVPASASATVLFPAPGSRAFIAVYDIGSAHQVCQLSCGLVDSTSTPLDLPPTTFTGPGGLAFISAEARITPTAMHSLITGNAGGELDLAMNDTYTVQGTATGVFPVTVTLHASGQMNSSPVLTSHVLVANVKVVIGSFNIDPAATLIPTVDPFDPVLTVDQLFTSRVSSSPFTVPVDVSASYTRMVSVGNVFDVGYELLSTFSRGEIDLSHTADISFSLPQGVFITSALGATFGTPPTPPPAVPEPASWAMMLMGFAGLGWAARRTRRGRLAGV
jgi:hypothetical protein